jgi:orotate phosphoribosyltransferase
VSDTLTAPSLRTHLGDPLRLAELLGRADVMCEGHFRLLSGLHSDRFVRFSRLADDHESLAYIAELLAGAVASWKPEAIVAPSTAGVSLGVALGRRLGVRLHLCDVGDDGRPTKLIGDAPVQHARMLIVNDVITTGEGVKALASISREAGTDPIGSCAFIARTTADVGELIGLPVAITAAADLAAWTPEECPLCGHSDETPEDARDLN